MNILVSGSLAYDRIMDFPGYFKDHILADKIHVLSVSFQIRKIEERFGGTAGNIAYNLSLLKEKPIILSSAGNDFTLYKKWLKKHRIDLRQIRIKKTASTSSAYIITDKADNQISGFYPGVMEQSVEYQLNDANKTNSLACISPGNKKEMTDLALIYQKKGIFYLFDPGQQLTNFKSSKLRQILKGAKIFISNDYELALTLKISGWKMRNLLKYAQAVITTLGEKGSVIITKNKTYKIPIAKPKKVVDPTGAGDAYRAGIIKGLVKNYPWPIIGRLAATVAVYAVEQYGTQEHQFTWVSLQKRYYQNFSKKSFPLNNLL